MGQAVKDKFLQEGNIPDPSYGGKLTDFYSSPDGKFREGESCHCILLSQKKYVPALYVGGIRQPNMGASPRDITVKVTFK